MANTVILEVKESFNYGALGDMKVGERLRATRDTVMGMDAYRVEYDGEDFYYSIEEFQGDSVETWFDVLPEDGGAVKNEGGF